MHSGQPETRELSRAITELKIIFKNRVLSIFMKSIRPLIGLASSHPDPAMGKGHELRSWFQALPDEPEGVLHT
jgi:hypothetical protein